MYKLPTGGGVGDSMPASPYTRMIDPRAGHVNALHDLLEEEKRQQQAKQEGDVERSSGTLLSDHDFEKLKADVVNDPSKFVSRFSAFIFILHFTWYQRVNLVKFNRLFV